VLSLVLAVVGIAAWFAQHQQTPQPVLSTSSFNLSPQSGMPPEIRLLQTTNQKPEIEPSCPRHLANGEVLVRKGYSKDGHRIVIHNGSEGDAIVKVKEPGSNSRCVVSLQW
jgi:hypothetical protein